MCRGQLGELQSRYSEFRDRNSEILAISIDSLDEVRNMTSLVQPDFHILSDDQATVSKNYQVFDVLDDRLAAPAVFIVGKDGSILWRRIGENAGDRPSSDEILSQLSRLGF
ncbi:MAG: peroxiredoxin family protein [Dehalococcoidia bacterium]